MAPVMALKAAVPFLGNPSGFRARCRGQAPTRTRFVAPQAYSITLKTPEGEQKIDCSGRYKISSYCDAPGNEGIAFSEGCRD